MREWEKRDIVDILTEQHVEIVQASVELSEGGDRAGSAELDHDALVIERYLETDHGLAWDGREFSTAPVSDELRAVSIKRWIRDGHAGLSAQDIDTTDLLLEAAGRCLDKACSHDIMGEILFESGDGKIYAGCVEFMITEANPEYVKDVLAEEARIEKLKTYFAPEEAEPSEQEDQTRQRGMTFADIKFESVPSHSHDDGIRGVVMFKNGYGLSIVRNKHSYGGDTGLYETALLKAGATPCCGPITYNAALGYSDVRGWLSEADVEQELTKIENATQFDEADNTDGTCTMDPKEEAV